MYTHKYGLPGWFSGKETASQCRRHRFNPYVGKIPRGGHDNPLQYSCLGNPMDRGAWRASHRVTKSGTQLSDWAYTQTQIYISLLWASNSQIFYLKNNLQSQKILQTSRNIGMWVTTIDTYIFGWISNFQMFWLIHIKITISVNTFLWKRIMFSKTNI